MKKLPRTFRGCMFDDGWEFDAPCVIYYPLFKFGFGGNSSHLESMVQDVCLNIEMHGSIDCEKLRSELVKECKWRGWNIHGFQHRQNAWHVQFKIKWILEHGEPRHSIVTRKEIWGPFK